MTTVTVWLLISIGASRVGSSNLPTQVVERFASKEECERVRLWMAPGKDWSEPRVGCIQATVVR